MEVELGAQLNIKDPETVRLARDMAGRSGKSVTDTVRGALEAAQRAELAEREERRARLFAKIDEVLAQMPPEMRRITSKEAMDSLYDDGVPA